MTATGANVRHPWPKDFPLAWTHMCWRKDGQGTRLAELKGYKDAKEQSDAHAAIRVVNQGVNARVLDDLADFCDEHCPDQVSVVAPSIGPPNATNALSLTYAKYLSEVLEWELVTGIYQRPKAKRDRRGDRWFRLANEPEFYGSVQPGRSYVLADDVIAAGGTLAALKGFIEGQGGYVVAMSALASLDGLKPQLALNPQFIDALRRRFGSEFADQIREELGYDVACLTQPEAEFLLQGRDAREFTAGILGGRNPQDVG